MKPPYLATRLGYPTLAIKREDLFARLGWQSLIYDMNYINTCAIRLSVACMKAGVVFPRGGLVVRDGELVGKRIEPSQAKLSHMLTEMWGKPEKYRSSDSAALGIGNRKGVVSFFRIDPMSPLNQGHIDLIEPLPHGFKQCQMNCYFSAVEIWFWELP